MNRANGISSHFITVSMLVCLLLEPQQLVLHCVPGFSVQSPVLGYLNSVWCDQLVIVANLSIVLNATLLQLQNLLKVGHNLPTLIILFIVKFPCRPTFKKGPTSLRQDPMIAELAFMSVGTRHSHSQVTRQKQYFKRSLCCKDIILFFYKGLGICAMTQTQFDRKAVSHTNTIRFTKACSPRADLPCYMNWICKTVFFDLGHTQK